MRSRTAWKSEEDRILRVLVEERGEIGWSTIARMMQQQFGIKGKTGKKCRERYHNHLKANITNSDWTTHQDQSLLTLHQQYGNKWASIAQLLPGRSENCVKNRFYSKLRKICRKLNSFNTEKYSQHPSAIPLPLVSQIVAVSESRFKTDCKISEEWIDFSTRLVNTLYTLEPNLQKNQIDHHTHLAYAQAIKQIAYFDNNFKKKKIMKNSQREDDYKQRITYSKKQGEMQRRSKHLKELTLPPMTLSTIAMNEYPVKEERVMNLQGEIEMDLIFEELKGNQSTFESFDELENHLLKMNIPLAMFEESEQYPYQYRELSNL